MKSQWERQSSLTPKKNDARNIYVRQVDVTSMPRCQHAHDEPPTEVPASTEAQALLLRVTDTGPGLGLVDYRTLFDPSSEFGMGATERGGGEVWRGEAT